MTLPGTRRQRAWLAAGLALASALAAWWTTPRRPLTVSQTTPASAQGAPPDAMSLALVGDAALSLQVDTSTPEMMALARMIGGTSLGVANFELSVAAPSTPTADQFAPRSWPAAAPAAAEALKALGIGAVSLANNHAFDFGAAGLAHLQELLAAAGVAFAGAGDNLDAARAARVVESPAGRVALVAAAISAAPGARATPRRGDINGRPGVHALRYTRRLTVDDTAFGALAQAFPPSVLRSNGDGRTWELLGLTVERGTRAGMALVPDAGDLDGLAATVRDARMNAAAVVVSLHAHEPGNRIDEVPDLLQTVARRVIDAGADVVAGHGPHRLRGIEIYRGRPIFYSLGNFVFPDRGMSPAAADPFEDTRTNLLSPFPADSPGPALDFDGDQWWQSVVAVVRLAGGRVQRVELHPVDVGIGQPAAVRGLPRLAEGATASAILERLRRLSAPLGTAIAVEHGIGVIEPPRR